MSKEVQKHGFSWEKEIIRNIYEISDDDIKKISYTSKMDIPRSLNRLDAANVSIKTSGSLNSVCMGDCLRFFDSVSCGECEPIHMIVIHYVQNDATNTKKIVSITEVDLTNSVKLLFGTLTRAQIEELDKEVKKIPQRRKPTPEEHEKMYGVRDTLQGLSLAIHLDIKCNSQQSRLQCSFNHFQKFLKDFPERIMAVCDNGLFRGKKITEEIQSGRRTFKAPQVKSPQEPHS